AGQEMATGGWLKQRQAVGHVQTVLVGVVGHFAAQAGVAPGEAEPFERAFLQHVIQAEVTLPLLLVARGVVDVVTGQVGHRCLQTRYTELAEVVAIACQPGTLAGAGELADLAVGDQVGGGAITLVEEGEGAVARNLLVAGVQLVAAVGVGEQRAPGAVVHFTGLAVTRIPVAAAAETFGTSGHAAVLAVRIAVEVAQVALKVAAAERVVVHQAEEVLFVEVFQVAVVVLRGQVLGDLVVTTGEVEGIDELAGR